MENTNINTNTNTNILEFLNKLDNNLSNSLKTFQTINKSNINDLSLLHDLIKKNNTKLFNYLECLKQLETLYFSKRFDVDNKEQFLMSFDIDNDLYNKDFKKQFIKNQNIDINIHKLMKCRQRIILKEETKTIDSIESIDISPNKLEIPTVKNLKDMHPMFCWFNGDAYYKKGIYVCISKGLYAKVPFPSTVSTNTQNFKVNSIPCKYITKERCADMKLKISKAYNSDVRECSYVHKGEQFVKIGTAYRCSVENFGNHETLHDDIKYVDISDIKRILMYSLSDTLLCTLWYQNSFKDGDLILNNIETFNK